MTIRVVLGPSVSRDSFERFAAEHGWRLHRRIPRSVEAPYEVIWSIGADTTAAHYIEDDMLGIPYVLVMGEDEHGIARRLREGIDTVVGSYAARSSLEASSKEERIRAISYLAAAAPPRADSDLLRSFATLLTDRDSDIRRHAIFACAYPSWPELDPLLEHVWQTDQDPELRAAAGKALEAIRRHRGRGGYG